MTLCERSISTKDNLNKKFNVADRTAIANALESLDRGELAKNLNIFGKAFGCVGKAIDAMDLLVGIKKGYGTGGWNRTVLKVKTLFAGAAATSLIAEMRVVYLNRSLHPEIY